MVPELPKRFSRQQREIEAQIREAFKGVTRERGVSWSEAEVIDAYGSPEERRAARDSDKDTCWEELVDNAGWQHEVGMGGFTFLDAIGFRYYLPAAMIRCLRNCSALNDRLAFALAINDELRRSLVVKVNDQQAHAVARFLRFMNAALNAAYATESIGQAWLDAYKSYWCSKDRNLLPGEPGTR